MKLTKEESLAAIKAACNVKAGWSEEAQKALEEREAAQEANYIVNHTPDWVEVQLEALSKLYYWDDKRYAEESQELAILANKQLNLEKNVKKGDFEDITFNQICDLLAGEQQELENELFEQLDPPVFGLVQNRKDINYQRAREEIGDVAACLVGLLAKLNKMEKEEK